MSIATRALSVAVAVFGLVLLGAAALPALERAFFGVPLTSGSLFVSAVLLALGAWCVVGAVRDLGAPATRIAPVPAVSKRAVVVNLVGLVVSLVLTWLFFIVIQPTTPLLAIVSLLPLYLLLLSILSAVVLTVVAVVRAARQPSGPLQRRGA